MELFMMKLIEMSLKAGAVILMILILRIPVKRISKRLSLFLWIPTAFRLLCPTALKSRISVLSGVKRLPGFWEAAGTQAFSELTSAAVRTEEEATALSVYGFIAVIWSAGVLAMFAYILISSVKMRKICRNACHLKDNVYTVEGLSTAFTAGLFSPKIYVPTEISMEQQRFMICHENAHIHCKDPFWKLFAFLLLTVHWFNPIIWLGFILFSRDLELACDERVLGKLNAAERKAYANTLLSVGSGAIIPMSSASFSSGSLKARIRAAARFRKPAAWAVALAIPVLLFLAGCIITDPAPEEKTVEISSGNEAESMEIAESRIFLTEEHAMHAAEEAARALKTARHAEEEMYAAEEMMRAEEDAMHAAEEAIRAVEEAVQEVEIVQTGERTGHDE